MEKQNRNITSGDIQNAVLGETKQVLEIMVESKKKVSNLQQNLKHIEDIIKQLQIDIGIRKDFGNNRKSTIESNETFKQIVKELNRKFLTFAEQIYSCGQDLFKEQNFQESELDKIYALSTTSEKTYDLRKKQYEIEEKNLLNQLQNIEEQISKNKKKCLASKKENQALNEELSNLDREISLYEKQNCEREKNLNEEITLHETEIGLLNEKLALAVEEISTNDQLLAEMSKKKVAREESASESLLTLDKMIQEIQDELTSRNKQMEELINASNDLNNQITGTDCLIKVSETEIVQREMELKDMETKLIMIEQNYSDEINMHQENMSSTEKELTDEKQLNMTLSTELSSYDRRIEELDLEIKNEKAYIDDLEARPVIDFANKLEEKKIEINDVKTMKQNSKEQLKSLITKQQEQMKKEQIEISELETTNKSLAEKTSLGEVEITKLQTEEKLKIAENLELEESITELDSKIENLNKAITAKKADSNFMYPKTLRESAVAQKPPNKITPIRAHNWDSDTSFEGEDRSYAERGRLKLKLPMLKKATVK